MDWLGPIYIALKALAYCAWCWLGLVAASPQIARHALVPRGLGFGLLRLALGFAFGLGIWLASSFVLGVVAKAGLGGRGGELVAYVLVYVPVRPIEWGIVSRLAFKRPAGGWIAGGVLVSMLADLPMVASFDWHLPMGRFLC